MDDNCRMTLLAMVLVQGGHLPVVFDLGRESVKITCGRCGKEFQAPRQEERRDDRDHFTVLGVYFDRDGTRITSTDVCAGT